MGHRKGLESLAATYGGLRDLDSQAIGALKKKYMSILPELETEVTDTTLKAQIEEKEKRIQSFEERMDELRMTAERLKDMEKRIEERFGKSDEKG
jgi:chaperonin cofactor prefoldin